MMTRMTLQDMQRVSLEILKDVHSFCLQHGINYTLFGGTLIGAVRHNGFIPWDDDVDIAMPRPDYDRFVNTYSSEKGYQLFARERQHDDVFIAYARVCEMSRTYVDTANYPWSKYKTGVWIDIFPLDGMPSNKMLAKLRTKRANRVFVRTGKARTIIGYSSNQGDFRVAFKHMFMQLLLPYYKQWNRLIRICKKVSFDKSDYYSNLSFGNYGFKEYCTKKVLCKYQLHRFEDYSFQIMQGYDLALTNKYGDYMQLPPKEQQVGSHTYNYLWTDD